MVIASSLNFDAISVSCYLFFGATKTVKQYILNEVHTIN